MADQPKSQRGPERPKKGLPSPNQKATISELANIDALKTSSVNPIDQKILDRIKKCLNRANHPNTPEMEAKAAWRMSSRLMEQYNVTQADVLDAVKDDDLALIGGQSTVLITSTKDQFSRVISQAWVEYIATAMTILFDCSTYSTGGCFSIKWTFYGIAANTVPAAMAFEMAHNLTLDWARAKKGAKHSYCMGVGDGLVRIARREKNAEADRAKEAEARAQEQPPTSPRQGTWPTHDENRLMGGLKEEDEEDHTPDNDDNQNFRVKLENEVETHDALDEDEDEDLDGEPYIKLEDGVDTNDTPYEDMAGKPKIKLEDDESTTFDDEGMSDDENYPDVEPTFKEEYDKPIDLTDNFEDQLQSMMPQHEPNTPITPGSTPDIVKKEEKTSPSQPPSSHVEDDDEIITDAVWQTSQALVKFRQTSAKVAQQFLERENVELVKGKRRRWSMKNEDVYRQGVEDSKKIDLKRRRLEGAKET